MGIEFPEVAKIKPTGNLLVDFSEEDIGSRKSIPLPWTRLSDCCNALRPGSVVIVGGPAGYGKTLFCQQIAAWVELNGLCGSKTWYYLPLEDRASDWMRRILAHLTGEWPILSDNQAEAMLRAETLCDNPHAHRFNDHICENPRLPVEVGGQVKSPALPFKDVLQWVKDSFNPISTWEEIKSRKVARLLFIDSISFIDFGEPSYKGQKLFISHLVGLATKYEATVVLVAHTIKRQGRDRGILLSGEDLAGAAEFHRLAHTVLLLDQHDPTLSQVHRSQGILEEVEHNRTIIVDKCRYGKGMGSRIAFNLKSPSWDELGVIAHKKKGEKKCDF